MKENTKILELVYTFFLGLILVIFIGVGVNTFYAGPVAPDWDSYGLNTYGKEPGDEEIAAQQEFEIKQQQHNKDMEPYNRNVSIIVLAASVMLLGISLVYEKKIKVLADGVMLGGLFTLFYSLGRGFASGNSQYSFFAITVGLIMVLYLGFHRFVSPQSNQKSNSKTK